MTFVVPLTVTPLSRRMLPTLSVMGPVHAAAPQVARWYWRRVPSVVTQTLVFSRMASSRALLRAAATSRAPAISVDDRQ